jgi:hypothetical protein
MVYFVGKTNSQYTNHQRDIVPQFYPFPETKLSQDKLKTKTMSCMKIMSIGFTLPVDPAAQFEGK